MKTQFHASASQPILLTAAASLLLVGIAAATTRARAAEPTPRMVLQGVMAKLGRDMQAVTGAIAVEDWAAVARLAPGIARHPEPPLSEKLRILAWLGGDAGKFRAFDIQAHDAALAMGQAAQRGDGGAVIDAFARTQRACLGCHQGYRQRFIARFHDRR
ncbi:MAG: cytochrome C [Thermomonas sp.]|uniref:cytochrome C n=1 Tax=Thermomonas sp. TaxID=1971895 RepID=UPI001D1C2087|nr:cytochrome C [Thermomonas sp.]MBZ0088157.1 cytochrome C [Thermomonas sp.]